MKPPAAALLLSAVAALVGCQGGNLNVAGYTTEPPFDPAVRTVYIPVFKNTVFHAGPARGVEVDITEAIVRELNARRSPMRVVSDPAKADTELVGTVTGYNKGLQNRNLLNFVREADIIISCNVVWRDLRNGRSLAYARPLPPPAQVESPFDPTVKPPDPPLPDATPASASVTGYGRMLPELGESNTTAQQAAVKQIARQVVNMMERPW